MKKKELSYWEMQVPYWMMQELQYASRLYESTISDCFYSVCHKHGISKEEQEQIKGTCIERVTKALNVVFA